MSTFGQINLLVRDMAATVAFYRLLELEFDDAFEWPAGSGAEHIDGIRDDDAYMVFDNPPMARIWSGAFDADRPGGNIVVGLMGAIVVDPDGNQVGLKSPIEPDRRYVPAVDG